MAPKKQNRYATSKTALYALDQDESSIFISVPNPSPARKRRTVILGGAVIFISTLAVFLMTVDHTSNFRFFGPIQQGGLSDSTSQPITTMGKMQSEVNISPPVKPESIPQTQVVRHLKISTSTTTLPSKDSGTVFLTSTPWAKVYIDNALIGETPISKPLTLSVGTHAVTFMHPSFDPILQTISVQNNKELHVAANFLENAGFLCCNVIPWAEVYVDEQYKDTTPLEKPIVLSPGTHQVRFKNKTYMDVLREVTIKSKDTTSLSILFEKQR